LRIICLLDLSSQSVFVTDEPDNKPQTLLFSATVPRWVQKTARKYLRSDIMKLDLVGEGTVRTATTVEVHSPAVQSRFVYIWFNRCNFINCTFFILQMLRVGMNVFIRS